MLAFPRAMWETGQDEFFSELSRLQARHRTMQRRFLPREWPEWPHWPHTDLFWNETSHGPPLYSDRLLYMGAPLCGTEGKELSRGPILAETTEGKPANWLFRLILCLSRYNYYFFDTWFTIQHLSIKWIYLDILTGWFNSNKGIKMGEKMWH